MTEPMFNVPIPEPQDLECSNCGKTVLLPVDGARSSGWRIITSTTLGGQPYRDVLCSSCSGVAGEVPSWDWKCSNCDTRYSDTQRSMPVPLLDVNEAWRSASRHRCEPSFEFLPPGINNWIPDWDPMIITSISAD